MQVYDIGKIGEKIVYCNNCYAKIGYFPADVNCKYIGMNYVEYLKCPICGKPILLKKEGIVK